MVEYRGSTFRAMSMEGRMTVCNMSIEWGARAGMIAPDQVTFDYLKGRPHAPVGADWDAAVEYWTSLRTDDDAEYDAEIVMHAAELAPFVTWGTNPGQGAPLSSSVPDPADFENEGDRVAATKALEYMDSRPAPRCATSRSTPSSSDPARTAASKTCAPSPRSWTAAWSRPACGCWSCPARCEYVRKPSRRAWTRSSSTPAPSGDRPVVRCAWA